VRGRQPIAPAAFTPGEIPGTHFQRLSRPQGTWFSRKEPRKISQVTPPGIDPGTVRLVAQRLNHYAIPESVISTVDKSDDCKLRRRCGDRVIRLSLFGVITTNAS
jgi:hypothetical protein